MNEIKMSVSITLPGSVMLTQAEAKQLEKVKEGMGFSTAVVRITNKKGKSETHQIKVRRCHPAMQNVKLTKEAYHYMRSIDSCPSTLSLKLWRTLSPSNRLKIHLDLMRQHFGGISYTYQIFDD